MPQLPQFDRAPAYHYGRFHVVKITEIIAFIYSGLSLIGVVLGIARIIQTTQLSIVIEATIGAIMCCINIAFAAVICFALRKDLYKYLIPFMAWQMVCLTLQALYLFKIYLIVIKTELYDRQFTTREIVYATLYFMLCSCLFVVGVYLFVAVTLCYHYIKVKLTQPPVQTNSKTSAFYSTDLSPQSH